jgi:hypothetical protein
LEFRLWQIAHGAVQCLFLSQGLPKSDLQLWKYFSAYLHMPCLQVDFATLERKRNAEKQKAEFEMRQAIAKQEENLKQALKEFTSHF